MVLLLISNSVTTKVDLRLKLVDETSGETLQDFPARRARGEKLSYSSLPAVTKFPATTPSEIGHREWPYRVLLPGVPTPTRKRVRA